MFETFAVTISNAAQKKLYLYIYISILTVPNVSFQVYAPGFFARFTESHAVMLQGNSDLKVKEGEVTSRPWQWPINYRVNFPPLHNGIWIILQTTLTIV